MLSLKLGLVMGLGALLAATMTGGAGAADEKAEKKNPVVTMETNLGAIQIELDPEHAPVTVKNFLEYTRKGFYNGTIFHRVMPDFMIQGGGFTPDFEQKKTNPPITNEGGNGLKNLRGTIAMARTSGPNSATAQFFINVKDNDFLNREKAQDRFGYAVFGKVTKGMEVVDKIKDVKTGDRPPFSNVPETPVVIKSVTVKE